MGPRSHLRFGSGGFGSGGFGSGRARERSRCGVSGGFGDRRGLQDRRDYAEPGEAQSWLTAAYITVPITGTDMAFPASLCKLSSDWSVRSRT